ncbi:Uncharacterised protein [Enterobacter cloacae]|nr:Uncharacterised protein [Enterobacter cloacae]
MRLMTPGKNHKQHVWQNHRQTSARGGDAPEGVFEAKQQSTCYHSQKLNEQKLTSNVSTQERHRHHVFTPAPFEVCRVSYKTSFKAQSQASKSGQIIRRVPVISNIK